LKRNIAAVVLAAGSSSRMGTPKQLLRVGSGTLLRHAVEQAIASSVRATFVVAGANAGQMHDELRQLPVSLVENARFAEGMGTSISAAIHAIETEPSAFDAVVLLTCDQPNVSAALIDKLIAEHARSAPPLVASAYAGTLGIPALFARDYFKSLRELSPDKGAKEILMRHPDEVVAVPFEPAVIDIDTPADYEQFAHDAGATAS
jgi:molybdenum cofactor cytidylyltransferase